MLKIKDNVDLKELEKFGFEGKGHQEILYYKKETKYIWYWVDKQSRIIEITADVDEDIEIDNTLYDLITARISRKGRGGKIRYGKRTNTFKNILYAG